MISSDLVASTTVPAFSIDSNGEILAWNKGATELFGCSSAAVLGQRCWDVIGGYDLFGNHYCSPSCPLIRMARSHEAVNRCELCFRVADDRYAKLGVSTISVCGKTASELEILHLFTRIDCSSSRTTCGPLTPRESDVLARLATGKRTPTIARQLSISEATVRHHIQNIFHKLEVHTRLEAVCKAQKMGILESGDDPESSWAKPR